MSDVREKIERGLILWLREKRDIFAITAHLGDTEESRYDGCDTCGYGSSEMTFEIVYQSETHGRANFLEVEGDPLGFFPELYEYIERAN